MGITRLLLLLHAAPPTWTPCAHTTLQIHPYLMRHMSQAWRHTYAPVMSDQPAHTLWHTSPTIPMRKSTYQPWNKNQSGENLHHRARQVLHTSHTRHGPLGRAPLGNSFSPPLTIYAHANLTSLTQVHAAKHCSCTHAPKQPTGVTHKPICQGTCHRKRQLGMWMTWLLSEPHTDGLANQRAGTHLP
jgi:hypothetical protein